MTMTMTSMLLKDAISRKDEVLPPLQLVVLVMEQVELTSRMTMPQLQHLYALAIKIIIQIQSMKYIPYLAVVTAF